MDLACARLPACLALLAGSNLFFYLDCGLDRFLPLCRPPFTSERSLSFARSPPASPSPRRFPVPIFSFKKACVFVQRFRRHATALFPDTTTAASGRVNARRPMLQPTEYPCIFPYPNIYNRITISFCFFGVSSPHRASQLTKWPACLATAENPITGQGQPTNLSVPTGQSN